ncbi:MAG: nucleoside-diphosphate kinase [Candidatus Pacebacteria bacterium]|nr:nucleoside-diphosphate kinase [Candidatus Paceibacterota bacterium]
MKYSFGVLKPDCIKLNLVDRAIELVCSRGLRIIFSKKVMLKPIDVEFLYSRCRQLSFFENLLKFMTSGEIMVYITESTDSNCAIRTLNSVTGHTNPVEAKPDTLRSMGKNVCENIAHSTADEQTFWSEVRYFLTKEEIKTLRLES